MGLEFTIRRSGGMRVHHVRKSNRVRVDHEEKSDGAKN